jgi:hypothetical protein
MTNRIVSVLFALACGLLCSCSSVASKRPVGDEPVVLDKAKWNGIWTTSDGDVVFTRVEDSSKGLIEIAGISLHETEIKVEKHLIQILKTGEWLWANMKSEKEGFYQFARISEPGEQLIYWIPKAGPFIERVRKGDLKGELPKDDDGKEKGEVILESLSAQNIKDIEAGKWGNVIAWEDPQVFRRLKAAK